MNREDFLLRGGVSDTWFGGLEAWWASRLDEDSRLIIMRVVGYPFFL